MVPDEWGHGWTNVSSWRSIFRRFRYFGTLKVGHLQMLDMHCQDVYLAFSWHGIGVCIDLRV